MPWHRRLNKQCEKSRGSPAEGNLQAQKPCSLSLQRITSAQVFYIKARLSSRGRKKGEGQGEGEEARFGGGGGEEPLTAWTGAEANFSKPLQLSWPPLDLEPIEPHTILMIVNRCCSW